MADQGTYEDFINEFSPLLDELASAGWTPSEAYSRLVSIYPEVNSDNVHRAIYSGNWTFVGRKEHILNNVMMAAALWYAVAITHDLEPDREYTVVKLDPIIAQDLPRLFETAGVSPETIASIMSRCGAALKHLSANPYIRLDEASYDDFLENLPDEAQNISDGVLTWPPNRMIIEDRLGEGSFSSALLRVGICPPDLEDLELTLAPASLTDRTFRNALGEFLSYCIRYDRRPTVLLYGAWAVARNQLGRVPLLGTVRGKYGSWHRALKLGRRMVNDALHMGAARAVPVHSPPTGAPTGRMRIEDLNAQGIGVVRTPSPTPAELQRQAWTALTDVLAGRLQELPWNQTLRVYYITPQAEEYDEYTPYAAIMRSPGGYLCELTDSYDFTTFEPDYDIDYLIEHNWAEPRDGNLAWSQNFLDPQDAAQQIIEAMRLGMGCQSPDYFQSDDPAASPEADIANPSTGSVPMVQPHQVHSKSPNISIDPELKK